MIATKLSKIIAITPTIVPAAYADGDVIDSVKEVADAVAYRKGNGEIRSIAVIDKANQKVDLDLYFFDEAPENSVGSDNTAFTLNDADAPKLLGRVRVATADYISAGSDNALATKSDVSIMVSSIAGSKSIFMLAVSRGTPTYASASDLIIKLGIEQY